MTKSNKQAREPVAFGWKYRLFWVGLMAGIAWLDSGLLASALVTSTVILVLTTLWAIEIAYETIENGAIDYKSLGQSAVLAVAMAGFIAVFGRWELAVFAVAAGVIISVRLLYYILVR